MQNLQKADKPTMYFIGVTTRSSSIMNIFPQWAKALGFGDAVLEGIDIGIHADPQVYRDVVAMIKQDPLTRGALVTTHKLDLYQAAHDLFDYLDPYARRFGELSSISKKDDRLEGYAKDPISSGLALDHFLPHHFWRDHGGEVFIMGAGGSAIAIGAYLMRPEFEGNYPSRMIVANRSLPRLQEIETIFRELAPAEIELSFHLTPEPGQNDQILRGMKPYSLVVNATGLGKDRPGSPLLDTCLFPEDSQVWEINYRGQLDFMQQALRQQKERRLHVEDGWIYFIYGWTQVMAEVFHVAIDEARIDELSQIAREIKG